MSQELSEGIKILIGLREQLYKAMNIVNEVSLIKNPRDKRFFNFPDMTTNINISIDEINKEIGAEVRI